MLKSYKLGFVFILLIILSIGWGIKPQKMSKRASFNPDTLLIFVNVKLDNEGPFTFIIDTGAMASLIDKSLAERFSQKAKDEFRGMAVGFGEEKKLESEDSLKITRLNFKTIQIGELVHKDFKPFVMDISHISNAIGSSVDGVIGFDLLSSYKLFINYKNGEIIFAPLPEYPETNGTTFELFMNHVYVPVIIEGKRFPFLLDTGASHCVLSRKLVDSLNLSNKLKPSRTDTLVGASGTGGEISTYLLDSLTVDSQTTQDIEVAVVDLSSFSSILGRDIYGVIGHNFLKYFELIINYRDMRIFLR